MISNQPVDEDERGPRVGGNASRLIEGASEQATFASGSARIILNDHSHNNHSKQHYGDVHVTTNNYNAGQTNVDVRLNQARDLLLAHVSHGALHNSAQRGPEAPKCFPETRVAVQEEIRSWIKNGHQDTNPKTILWLSGPAGSGKTAIAGSIADDCHEEGLLAASFFFSSFAGSLDRCSKGPFIATLVYQLIQHDTIHGLRDEVLAALDRDPLILKRNLDAQAETLLLNPLRKVSSRSSAQAWPHLVLVDGLDECAGEKVDDGSPQNARKSQEDTHREVLSSLVRASSDPSFPFRIIIASRPEQAIKRCFLSLPEGSVKEVFLNDKYDPAADIELFLRAMLLKIGRDYRLQEDWYTHASPLDWPEYNTRDIPLYLAREASEQFVYAATVIRYVQDGTSTPTDQLRRILSARPQPGPNPFSALDTLYTMILQSSPTPLLSATWLSAINVLSHSVDTAQAWYIKALLESSPGETEVRLANLASIVGVPSDEENEFTFYHKSLYDFLEQPQRSGELYVGEPAQESFMEDRHCQVLKNRGPQINMHNDHFLNEFINRFWTYFHCWYKPSFLYDASDVDWWCSHADFKLKSGCFIQRAFVNVHKECPWHRCSSNCKVWRKGIVQHCQVRGWCLPTWAELLQDRFKKVGLDYSRPGDYPLRPIKGTRTRSGEADSRMEDSSSSFNSEPEESGAHV